MTASPELIRKCNATLDFAGRQLRHLIETYPDTFPMYTMGGKWKHGGEAWTNWCEGFLGGQLWLLTKHTHDPYWRAKAEHYSRLIEHRKTDRNVHDLGFLFWSTWKRWYDLTGDPQINNVVVEAGTTLSLRFKEKGQYLRSFVADESLFIDIMMNVGIIFYAAQQTGRSGAAPQGNPAQPDHPTLSRPGRRQHIARRAVRPGDGRVHPAEHAPGLARRFVLGARPGLGAVRFRNGVRLHARCPVPADRRGVRGVLHREHARSRRAAQRLGRSAESQRCPTKARPRPSPPAGCSTWRSSPATRSRAILYHEYALRILDTLTGPEFLAIDTPGWEGILKHGMYHQRKGLGVDESVMWGEYFFLEAVCKVLGYE